MEDEKIIRLFFARSEAALRETDRKYRRFLAAMIHRILRSQPDTEEVLNDTYMGAWNAMPPQKPNSLRWFLCGIARNRSFDRLDYKTAQKRSALFVELDECIPDTHGTPEQVWDEQELGHCLSRFLRSLPRTDRALFLGRYYFAHSTAELAKQHGLTPRQVKYRLSKIRSALRSHLTKEGVIL